MVDEIDKKPDAGGFSAECVRFLSLIIPPLKHQLFSSM
jgi:hypothetical protein